jgi:hypothetical protein
MENIENIENMERFEALSAAEMAALGKNKRAATTTLAVWVGMFIVFAAGAIWSGSRLYIHRLFSLRPPAALADRPARASATHRSEQRYSGRTEEDRRQSHRKPAPGYKSNGQQ